MTQKVYIVTLKVALRSSLDPEEIKRQIIVARLDEDADPPILGVWRDIDQTDEWELIDYLETEIEEDEEDLT